MTVYLTAAQVIAINAAVGGPGAGLDDLAVLEGSLGRPSSGFGDVETFPTLWLKAASLLHGIATTQSFSDGNKRTAWTVCETFLELNGVDLGNIDVLETEALVRAVADNECDVTAIGEWLQTEAVSRLPLARLVRRPRSPTWAAVLGSAAGSAAATAALIILPRTARSLSRRYSRGTYGRRRA